MNLIIKGIHLHDLTESDISIPELKRIMEGFVRDKTRQMDADGYEYPGSGKFSMGPEEKAEFLTLDVKKSILPYPISVGGVNYGDEVTFADSTDIDNFTNYMLNQVMGNKLAQQAIINSIRSASTLADLKAIEDNR